MQKTTKARERRARKLGTAGVGIPSQIWTTYICRVMGFKNYTAVVEERRGKEDKKISIFTPHAEYRPSVKRCPKNSGHINTTEKSNRKIKPSGVGSLWCREMQTYVRLGKWGVSNRRCPL
jgi:hypothetical protein